jgi:hypothetical protein
VRGQLRAVGTIQAAVWVVHRGNLHKLDLT